MSTLTFLQPHGLWALVLVIPLLGLKIWQKRQRQARLSAFSEPKIFRLVNPGFRLRGGGAWWAPLALAFMVVALARPVGKPQFIEEESVTPGLDIMLVVDCSSSMRATDIQPDRLQATKAALRAFLDGLEQDRVGLVVFAGSHALQSPLTRDYRALRMMVDMLSTQFLPVDGTATGEALAFAMEQISPDKRQGAVIILLTDGEQTRGQSPLEATGKVREAGIRVYTIGVGTPEGTRIPDGQDEAGRPRYKTYQGQPVITKLDEATLKRIAQETQGAYFSATDAEVLIQAYQEIGKLTKRQVTEKIKRVKYQEYFHWWLLPALLCLAIDLYASRRSAWRFWPRKAGVR